MIKHLPLTYTNCNPGFAEDYLKVYEIRANHLSNNLRLYEISILVFFEFYCKINKNQLEMILDATYGLHLNEHFKIIKLNLKKEA